MRGTSTAVFVILTLVSAAESARAQVCLGSPFTGSGAAVAATAAVDDARAYAGTVSVLVAERLFVRAALSRGHPSGELAGSGGQSIELGWVVPAPGGWRVCPTLGVADREARFRSRFELDYGDIAVVEYHAGASVGRWVTDAGPVAVGLYGGARFLVEDRRLEGRRAFIEEDRLVVEEITGRVYSSGWDGEAGLLLRAGSVFAGGAWRVHRGVGRYDALRATLGVLLMR